MDQDLVSVGSKSACITPATRELWIPVHCAVRGISLGVSDGVRTLSITWMRPLLATTSVKVTFASFTITVEPTVNERG